MLRSYIYLTIACSLALSAILPCSAQESTPGADTKAAKTIVTSPAQKKKLLGRHALSLQWISWDDLRKAGSAVVAEDSRGVITLKGEQKGFGKGKSDYLKVNGTITQINANGFKFHGRILTSASEANDGKECVRDGDMNFSIKGSRKYWRLVESKNPCSEVTDYVDLFFN